MLDCGFTEIFKAQCLLQIEGGLCLAVCRLVATQLSASWYAFGVAWLNSMGDELFLRFDVLSHRQTK